MYLFVEKLLIVIFVVFLLTGFLCFISFLLAPVQKISSELSSYECGLQPYKHNMGVFNLFSYKLSMLFIILDSEIVFVLFFVYFDISTPIAGWLSFLILLFLIILSVIAEICLKFLDFLSW